MRGEIIPAGIRQAQGWTVGKANKTGYPVLSSGKQVGAVTGNEMPEGSGLKDVFGLMVSGTSVCGEAP